MPSVLVCGRGGSGKSTLVALLAREMGERSQVLVIDTDESNLSLGMMMAIDPPEKTLMDFLGGKPVVRETLMSMNRSQGSESVMLFPNKLTLDGLPPQYVRWKGSVGLIRVGKIEHSNEGCACPIGKVAREFLNQLVVAAEQWALVDTEAGVEHFGRGVPQGINLVLMVVDPTYESVVLAEKTLRLAEEAQKEFMVVLNKVDETTEPLLRREIGERGITIGSAISYSPKVIQANLVGNPLRAGVLWKEVNELINRIGEPCFSG